IREIRNLASHSGQTNSEQDALDYILKVNEFIDLATYLKNLSAANGNEDNSSFICSKTWT
ncbi:hypothetical protein, partial [Bacteroides sp. 224]|uniref:hypothetical protein n=1 Tax=Bacteroides sp. 224 TaxID=2302936 RepID=UPI0019402B72